MKRIPDLFRPDRPLLSIEIFPPKTPAGLATLKERLEEYRAFRPDFISVTYGAGGGNRESTGALLSHIQGGLGVPAMAHLTCAGHTRSELSDALARIRASGVLNVIALRGDPPKAGGPFAVSEGGLAHASDLLALATRETDLSLACAGYPEGHVEAASEERDLDFLKLKIDQGARFVVTQFFLENTYFFRFRERLRRKGIQVPVVAGILPISNYSQITRFSILCGCTIPAKVMRGLHGRSDADQEKFGLDHAARQVEELLDHGVDGVHLYALNRREAVERLAPLVRERFPARA
ncbi:MAG: methylenetetrahydrofolate reductase [Bdellovibrionales bacterium]|nr:methylenetetrahydrofolate reductase [Bdellovibrionales bacterium]